MEDPERGLYAVQFHPEVGHTPRGTDMLKNFLSDACHAPATWTALAVIDEQVELIRAQVGDARVICGLSGGVDSAVAALLVHRAIGDQLTCVFVDHGLHARRTRPSRSSRRSATTSRCRSSTCRRPSASSPQLEGVTDPETKRKRIGETFIRVFEEESRELEDARFLVQGTLYPDVIESGSKTAAKIKSHHNVGGLPEDMDFELVEPLRWLFKDEVRRVGEELGLPDEIVWRQPFPGPGLAVRIIGEVTPRAARDPAPADAVIREEIRRAGLEREIWQASPCCRDQVGRRHGRRAHVRVSDHRARGHERGRDDGRLGAPARTTCSSASRAASSTRSPGVNRVASTSRRSRPARSSGSSRRFRLSAWSYQPTSAAVVRTAASSA